MKKKLLSIVLLFAIVATVFGCGNNDTVLSGQGVPIDDTNLPGTLRAVYLGGLYARSEVNDMILALYRSDGEPVVVITEFGETYYGSYTTKDAKLADGTEYTQITVQDKTYGYHFNEDLTGILVDQEGNKYEGKKLDETVASNMLIRALSNQ